MATSEFRTTNQVTEFPKKLFHCWHPVAYTSELANGKLFGATLLDEPILNWRSSNGKAHAMKDLCIHRETVLSLVWIDSDNIVCPYHGWKYIGEPWSRKGWPQSHTDPIHSLAHD